jgi:hypothetical protein
MKRVLALGAVAVALMLSGCSDDDQDTPTDSAPPDKVETPDGGATPPATPGQLPPEFIKCMADEGFEVKSSADIHSAPQQVLQACFGSIH